ncbi:MAG: OB-fold domain-containing protein [Pseudomonadota bacterium]
MRSATTGSPKIKEGSDGRQCVPFATGFLTEPLEPFNNVHLKGSTCLSCGITLFGTRYACENCCSKELKNVILSRDGKIYSYTIAHFPPPPPYAGPSDPFVPYAIAWVDLSEGVRVLSTLTDCKFEILKIGLDVELVIKKGWTDKNGNEVIIYSFKPI